MKDRLIRLYEKLKRPNGKTLILSYLLTAMFIASALLLMILKPEGWFLLGLSYLSYSFAALSLAYTVYTVVIFAPGIRLRIISALESRELTHSLLHSWGFRTIATALLSFVMSIAYALFNGVLGITSRSIWYGALAAYYMFLALMRGGLLLYHKKKRDFESEALVRAKNYRRCGIILLVLNAALSSAIAQMIFDDRAFEYKDWVIYAFAAYAFTKISMAIYNVIKAKRQDDLTIEAIREVGLVDGAVSILALQTALLHTFATDSSVDISLFNTLTGTAVSLFSMSLSIYMIFNGTKTIRSLQNKETKETENKDAEQ